MKRTGYKMKRFTAMILSACLVLSQGAVNSWAIGPETAGEEEFYVEAEIASASNAIAVSGTEDAGTASSSDAQFDEDGFLMDGEVFDDVIVATGSDAEIIASEMKTEVIEAQMTDIDDWYSDYSYSLDDENKTITLTFYSGLESELFVPSTAIIDGITYRTVLGGNDFETGGSMWGRVERLTFEEGVLAPENMSCMFSNCSRLKYLDIKGLDTSAVKYMSNMFEGCTSLIALDLSGWNTTNVEVTAEMFCNCSCLEEINMSDVDLSKVRNADNMFAYCRSLALLFVPTGLGIFVGLPHEMIGVDDETIYNYLPRNLSHSFAIKANVAVDLNVKGVELNTKAETILIGNSFQLVAMIQPSNATDKTVTWKSSNGTVAYVNRSGLVKALKAGTATITVTTNNGGYQASCKITVTATSIAVTGVKINTTSRNIPRWDTFQLAAWPQPSNATNKNVTWSSSDPTVAEVDNTGLVKAKKSGTTTVTVTTVDGGYTAECTITVRIPVTSLKLNTTSKTLSPGKYFQLAAWPQPTNADNRAVTWTSSDSSVAEVDNSGVVTALKVGTTTVTARTVDGGYSATCSITVAIPVTEIKINTMAKALEPGKTFQLVAWPQPANATNKAVTWYSTNSIVATVSDTGLVTMLRDGTATIVAKAVDGGSWISCKITTPIHVTGVNINTTAKTVSAGRTFQLAAWPQPSNATNKAVTWTSSNTAVATVSSKGLVKGVKVGTAVITVKTGDGGHTASCKITVTPEAVTGVKINTTAKTIAPGKSFQLAAWPQPSTAANKKVTWSSSNENVAMVSSTGLVIGVKTGTATITVKTADGGFTATCKITVSVPVTSVKINTTAKTIKAGTTFQMAAWPQPTNASNKAVTWSSSNENVAMVNSSGLVIGVKPGTATITVKTADGGKTATCKITVK